MRIISGRFKSRAIVAPTDGKTRPTSDRARETLFNILANIVSFEDARVLDVFAGSGAFAFEAMSRGASSITCVDRSSGAIAAIKRNAEALGVEKQTKIVRADVYFWVQKAEGSYDIIFADPPYDDPDLPETLPLLLLSSRLLTTDSIVIIEHRSTTRLMLPPFAKVVREHRASEAQFTIFERRGEPSEQTSDLSRDI